MPSPSKMINQYSSVFDMAESQKASAERKAPAEREFAIYKLTLSEIGKLMRKHPLEFPKNTLYEITIALNEIDNGFQELLTTNISRKHATDIKKILDSKKLANVQKKLIIAFTKSDSQSSLYIGSFLDGRLLINQINEEIMDPEDDP